MEKVAISCIPSLCKIACRRPAALLSTTAASSTGRRRAATRTGTGTTATRTLYRGAEDSEKVLWPTKHDAIRDDSTAVINQEDLSELNAEIGGFVGALGDADFDLEDDLLAPKQRDPSGEI